MFLPHLFPLGLEEVEPFFQKSEDFFKRSFNQIIKNINKNINLRQAFGKTPSDFDDRHKEKVPNGRQKVLFILYRVAVSSLIDSIS